MHQCHIHRATLRWRVLQCQGSCNWIWGFVIAQKYNIILHRNLNKNPIFMIMCYHLENWRAFILINKVIICCGYLLKQDISAYSGYPYEPDLPVAAMCQYHNICHKPYYSTGQTLRMSETTATFILPASDGCQLL